MRRQFVLCIGASKSGTTWLYHYLKNQPHYVPGLRKEYNALNSIFRSPFLQVKPHKLRVKSKFGDRLAAQQKAHFELCRSVDAYCEYFDRLVGKGGLTADISPGYLALSAGNLNDVACQMIDRGFDISVVVLLRDPVDRIMSFSRMVLRLRVLQEAIGVSGTTSLSEVAMTLLHDSAFNADYRAAINAVQKTGPDVNKFIYPYEALMGKEGVNALCQRLDLEHLAGFEDRHFNRAPAITEQEADFPHAYFARHLREQYQFCEEYFRSQNIPLQWRPAT